MSHRAGWAVGRAGLILGRAVVGVPIAYLSLLTAAAWVGTARDRFRRPAGPSGTRFVVLVPAHDEAVVIGDAVAALGALDYPADRVRVIVVADHCTDETAYVARRAGTTVWDHNVGGRGKGPALQWAIDRLAHEGANDDVAVIVDADTQVQPDFLRALDRHFAAGSRVVQGNYQVRDPEQSAGAAGRAAALCVRHHLRPLGRTTLGASAGLYGNGMAFCIDELNSVRWTGHLTEDAEMQMELVLAGVPIDFAADALVLAEMPPTLEAATTQNQRWEQGRLDVTRRYVPKLLRSVVAGSQSRRARVAQADAAIDVLIPPLSILAAATMVVATIDTAASVIARRRRAGGLGLAALLGIHVVSGLVMSGAPSTVYRSLLQAPRLVLWKGALWVRSLAGGGSTEWVRTQRAERDAPPT